MKLEDLPTLSVKSLVAASATMWATIPQIVQILVALMTIDLVMGFIIAAQQGKLDSDKAFKGITKKVLVLLFIAACALVAPLVQVPLAIIAAGFYCGHEMLSILENMHKAGLPVPAVREYLGKLLAQKPNKE